jgi:sulfate permease, SulP family
VTGRAGTPDRSWLRRHLPILEWLPRYDRSWLPRDAMAGLTVWALAVPESMAYAGIAGIPVQYGLYAIPLALVAYIIVGSSRELFVGPSATVATLSAAAIAPVVAAGAGAGEVVVVTAALSLLVGVIYVVLGLARMGFVARFFAKPVLDGFIVGLGIYIAVGQLNKIAGIEKPSGNTVRVFVETIGDIGAWQWLTVGVGITSIMLLFSMERFTPKLPGAIVVVVASILAAKVFDFGDHGVGLVGEVPTGFDFVSWSEVSADEVYHLIPGALAIVVVGFAQSVAIAKAYAAKNGYKVDVNQELLGYGAANLGAGALQGFTVTGSLGKTAAAEQAGGRSPVLLAVVAALVLATILFLAGLFADLPEAVLGAIVIQAVWGMINFSKLRRLWRAHFAEFWLALGALAGVVLIDILPGVLIGVALSFMLLIHRLDKPHVALLGRDREGIRFGDLDSHPDYSPVPGMMIYRFEAPLIFANADSFVDELAERLAAATPRPELLIVDFEAVPVIDTTGADALRQAHALASSLGIRLVLTRTTGPVLDFLRRDGVVEVLGEENVIPAGVDAVAIPVGV